MLHASRVGSVPASPKRWLRAFLPAIFAASAQAAVLQPAPTAEAPANAKVWIGRAQDFERFIETARIVRVESVPVGVTRPRRAYLAPGGLAESIACKTIRPGRYSGYWESYRSEIAAYELDKALELDMVPPTVERQIEGHLGAAVLWLRPVKSFQQLGGPPTPPADKLSMWTRQVVRAKMFDNLVNNIDPNLGNWLVDPAWNLILIDHTRAFASGTKQVHEMGHIDRELWQRIQALTEAELRAALSRWLDKRQIRDILKRRERMQQDIERMIAERGEARVFLP